MLDLLAKLGPRYAVAALLRTPFPTVDCNQPVRLEHKGWFRNERNERTYTKRLAGVHI
jgi:hypothetical protein